MMDLLIMIRLHGVDRKAKRTDLAVRLDLIESVYAAQGLTTVQTTTGQAYKVDESVDQVLELMRDCVMQARAHAARY